MGNLTYLGYHGTNSGNANRILSTNFSMSYRHTGSLGNGIYFFENDLELAEEYARSTHKGKQIRVIECRLEVPSDKVFDTADNEDDMLIFHTYRDELKISLSERGMRNIKSRNFNEFDGKVYNVIANKKGVLLIRAKTFTPSISDRENDIPNSYVPNGIELCLKHNAYVKDKNIN